MCTSVVGIRKCLKVHFTLPVLYCKNGGVFFGEVELQESAVLESVRS